MLLRHRKSGAHPVHCALSRKKVSPERDARSTPSEGQFPHPGNTRDNKKQWPESAVCVSDPNQSLGTNYQRLLSLHSDTYTGQVVDLAERRMTAVYSAFECWKMTKALR